MENAGINEFGEKLVQNVRDNAIKSCDNFLNPNASHPMAMRWKEASKSNNVEELLKIIIPDCIDETIFYLLHAIDQKKLELSFETKAGEIINLSDEGIGELAGWYLKADDGWRKQYSEERINDDFSDLDLKDLGL